MTDKPYQTPIFEPSEEDMYQFAVSRSLDKKISRAIALIKEYEPKALEMNENGYYVAFSGGKDSIVLLDLFRRAGVKHEPYYNNTTIDPPELIKFIRTHYGDVKWNQPKRPLIANIQHKNNGLPTQTHRWCCEIYKEHGGKGSFKAIGVRGPESPRRKGMWREINNHRKSHDPIMCPIVYWTDEDIWTYIKGNNMAYCQLYDEGMKRLGCVGCPMGNQVRDFARWPKYEAMWKRGARLFWDKHKGTLTKNGKPRWIEKFATFEDYWNWWIRNDKDDKEKDCQLWLW